MPHCGNEIGELRKHLMAALETLDSLSSAFEELIQRVKELETHGPDD